MNAIGYLPFAGRILIGLPFAMSGIGKLAAIGSTTELIRAAGLPLPPVTLAAPFAVELGGGLALIAGFRTLFIHGVLDVFELASAAVIHCIFARPNLFLHFLSHAII